ncbi:hypothetical protein D3C75_820740 [compost metagenome]
MIAESPGAYAVALLPPIACQHVDRWQIAALGNLQRLISRQAAVAAGMDLRVAVDGALDRFRECHGRGWVETCCQQQSHPHR